MVLEVAGLSFAGLSPAGLSEAKERTVLFSWLGCIDDTFLPSCIACCLADVSTCCRPAADPLEDFVVGLACEVPWELD